MSDNLCVCDECVKDLRDEPTHDVILVDELDGGELDLIGSMVCNKCMFEKFSYCTECDTYYEKKHVDETLHLCQWCKEQKQA